MFEHEGYVVMPSLPIMPSKPRRDAWRKVKSAGIKVKLLYRADEKDEAEKAAAECTLASGVTFEVNECIY
jgi:hypothetical protein